MAEPIVEHSAETVLDIAGTERIRVLHVDDDQAFLRMVKPCLDEQGRFEVETASSVKEALEKLKKTDYDVIVSDYQMPEEDGLEFLKQLREEGNDIPFIIFTGKGREEVAIKALNLGANQYLHKLGDPETVYCELAFAIRQAVAKRSAQIESLKKGAKLNAILESSPEAITITDLNGNIVECNQAAADLHGGQSKKDLIGKNAIGLIAKKDVEKARQNFERVIEQGPVKTAGYTLRTIDGREFPGEFSVGVVRVASGKPEYLVAITRDATERKKAEELLIIEKNKLEEVTKCVGAGLAIVSKDYRTLWANDFLKQTFGDVEGKVCYLAYNQRSSICPDCGVREIFETGKAKAVHEQVGKDADGKTVWSEITATPIKDKDGKITAALELVVPITQRKETESKLRHLATIVTDSNDAITVVGLDRRITAWNKGAERIYGYSEDEALGMDILTIVPEDKKQEILEAIGTIKMSGAVELLETKRLAKNGRVLDMLVTVTKLVDEQGNVALATTERDITEEKRLEERLRSSEKFRVLGQLASSVAHEIRNPLGVIKNSICFLNIRLKDHIDEKVTRHLRIMEESISSADRVISDLLDVARDKADVLEPVDLSRIIERTFASLSVPKNIKVITKLDKIPKMLLDPERIQRVFMNIIQNAVAAMPEGGELIVETSRSGDSVEISFKDSGVGIPEEDMQKLFTQLFTTKAKGLGLGLTICKQIVESHHGEIEARSKPGEGALFIIRLPILPGEELMKTGLSKTNELTEGISE